MRTRTTAVRSVGAALALTVLVGAPLSVRAAAQVFGSRATPANGACFYEDADYRGAYFCVRVDENLRSMPAGLNDRISSIRVFGRAEVTVYRDNDFRGGSVRFDGNVRNLDDEDWNDTISSLRVQRGSFGEGRFGGDGGRFRDRQDVPRQGACFYRDADFRGDRFCVAKGENVSSMPLGFNDEISSIQVFGASVMIFEHEGFAGHSVRVASPIRNLGESRSSNGFEWNDTISSLRVF